MSKKWYRHYVEAVVMVPMITQNPNPTEREMKDRVWEMDSAYFKDAINTDSFDVRVNLNESNIYDSEDEACEG